MTTPPPVPPPTDNWAGGAAVPMLGYMTPTFTRPWQVTGIGITSIVLSGLSLLSGLWSLLMLVPMLFIASSGFTTATATPAGASTPAGTISAADADAIAAALAIRQPLSNSDQALLSRALQEATTPFAAPADGRWTPTHVTNQITTTSSWNDGTTSSISFTFNGGDITLSGGSATVSVWNAKGSYTTTVVGSKGVTSTSTASLGPTAASMGFEMGGILLSSASTFLSMGLAVLLLVAGIQTVRGLPSGRTLHLWWAWPKIVVAIGAGFISYFTWNALTGGAPDSIRLAFAIGWVLLGIAWPITVLLLLRLRPVRAYYTDPDRPLFAS